MGANITELLTCDGEAEYFCGIDPRGGQCGCGVNVYKSFNEIAGKPDVIIDFSSPAVLDEELDYAVRNNVPAVIGSTGFTPEQLAKIDGAAKKVAIFRTANFSLGVNLLCRLVKRAAETLGEKFDIEIIEKHHNRKVDAPSGTALM
ncbi:MAG: 4-hydroxy-tetrahydrodipicolinate reductase, partial [Clostridia bacterium]|nr:4-hydroxy-tetrahydrodipicolinate reductase [Clostridia bacterium]